MARLTGNMTKQANSLPLTVTVTLLEIVRPVLVLVHATVIVCCPGEIPVNMCPGSPDLKKCNIIFYSFVPVKWYTKILQDTGCIESS